MKATNKSRRPKLQIADLTSEPRPRLRELAVEELVAVSGGLPDTGYVCSAPSNDCSKE